MSPAPISEPAPISQVAPAKAMEPTSILHRTPWRPPTAVGAEGSYIDLQDGRRVLDAVGGAAVCCLGNSHPKVMQAIKDQIDKVSYVYNMQLSNEPAEKLAKILIESSKGAFELCGFVSGGSEAMEGVIKLARQYSVETGQPQRKNFIARNLSFHGNTMATLSLAYHPTRRAPYEAMLDHDNYHHVSPAYAKRFQKPEETEEQYVERLRQELEDKFLELGPDTVIGFVAETVVGATTGALPAPKGYFRAMKSVCDKYGALFILDEVMSGMGRMGTLHAWESFGDGIAPDIQAVAKGLGGGYATIGAVLISKRVADGIRDNSGLWKHGHTYQAQPLACAAALAVQEVISSENLLENVRSQGAYLESRLHERFLGPNARAAPFTFDIRGGGGFWAIEFDFDGPEAASLDFKGQQFAMLVQARALENSLIVMGMVGGANLQGTQGDHIILAPAYNITREQIDTIVDVLVKSVEEASSGPRPVRSSTRIKAAQQKSKTKAKGKEREAIDPQPSTSTTPQETTTSRVTRSTSTRNRNPRDSSANKAGNESHELVNPRASKRPRRSAPVTSAALVINEPPRDLKGKKRAAPEPTSEEEAGPSKRLRTTSYSLRSTTTATASQSMPRKSKPATSKGKAVMKAKMSMASSSRVEDEDVDMIDAEIKQDIEMSKEEPSEDVDEAPPEKTPGDSEPVGGEEDEPDEEDAEEDDNNEGDGVVPSSDGAPIPGGMDETSAFNIFGGDYRHLGSYMMSLSSRLKTMLTNIKASADPTTRLLTLQELSELLSISTEDTLAGSFQVEAFVKELVRILGGKGTDEEDEEEGDDGAAEQDEDAALAAALAMSSGGNYQGDDNLEAQVLACRCLANLMEALPGVAHTVVYHGAIPALCNKLIEISYIDLAEQTLSTLEKISEEFPSSIVREGGLAALLNYLDFFSIAVQRTALQAASNCCRNLPSEHLPMISGVWSIIRGCLSYSDQRLVEFACLCVIRVVDSYYRSSVQHLEALIDIDLIRAVNQLLLPAGGSPLIATNTYTLLLRALATSARSSPKITLSLLEADIVDTLYQILTGVLPSASESEEQGNANDGQGLGGGLADMTVMENLAHRPKDQIEEALSLVSELMPPLPKDGVFDHKGYTEKSLARLIKAKHKADRAAARQAAQQSSTTAAPPARPESTSPTPPAEESTSESNGGDKGSQEQDDSAASSSNSKDGKEHAVDRTELLRSRPVVVDRFMQLMVPILVDVYAASVITPVRIKTLTGLLKAVSFLEADGLKCVLTYVPIASFASSVLSSRDHPSLVIGALQLVDLLLLKVPVLYRPTFRREGVFHEIDSLAERALTSAIPRAPKEKETTEGASSDSGSVPPVVPPIQSVPGLKKLSSLSLEPEDAITLRARVIRFKYLSSDEDPDDVAFESLRRLVDRISANGTEKDYVEVLKEMAELFASPHTSISSFELLQSGVVDALLRLTTDADRTVPVRRRKELLLDALVSRKTKGLNPQQTPFNTFVKKLQESLTRMESFDVVTVAQSSDDSKRSSPSLLARQLRLRLEAVDSSDIPRGLHNIVVSIHAIATFQALHDYLRPRVAGLLGSGSRLSGMLAALAASGLSGTTTRALAEELSQPSKPSASTSNEGPSPPVITRRRSQRLSAKQAKSTGDANQDASTSSDSTPANQDQTDGNASTSAPSSAPAAGDLASDPMLDSEMAADFTDDELEEVFEEDVEPDNSVAEKTVNLSVAEDGSKVEAQTPDGTRIATPNSAGLTQANKEVPSPTPRPGTNTKASYAAALKAKPTDWHLEFSMDDQTLPLDLTIYGAIHQHEMRKKSGAVPPSMIWQGVYTIKFKKVPGPVAPDSRADGSESGSKNRSPSPTMSSLPEDAPHAKILRLLRVLYQLNTIEGERSVFVGEKKNLLESAFVNNKVTAKLTRQLEEPMIVASSCLPDWALDLPQHFPFLFPFATRYNFLQSTSFGYARLILKWQSQQTRGQDTSRRDDGIGFLGRLQRQKVRISRKHILESAVKVFELYGSSSSVLEVEYFEEVGTGLGPTLEFYSLVSKEFARKDLKIWRDADSTGPGPYVSHPQGLYPAPLNKDDVAKDGGEKRTQILRVVGQFVAKAMLDSRIIDLSFNKVFLKLVLGEEVPVTMSSLKLVDIDLANSLTKLQNIAQRKKELPTDKLSRKIALIEEVNVEDLSLDFTLPGYDIELRPGGRDISVTADNVSEYIKEVLDAILGVGAQIQAKAFKEGFSKVFPVSDLQAFSADELVMLFGNSDEDWSIETLSEAVKADHGFNVESRAIRDLIEIMTDFDPPTRRAFLQFITGSPKLPIGGFRGLNPAMTVVRKPHEAPLTADDYLPSVMTCVNYLKLPEYSSKNVMKEKLKTAIREGVGSFHLS
ncbi:hypothetical protein BDN72DRAFT_886090 [Pluteus cervinus]|uniref:Uncharacterized protein n=1 Tax=Pluteus cervinus TaxID=181527 RepID=A0ACD3B9H8_9AGAR|nr:hypothetical protein BDN72DRAFT_886090 [Pluteus cervinus]